VFICVHLWFFLLGGWGAAFAQQPTVVAVVNGTPISDAMVKEVVKSLIAMHGPAPSSDEIAQLSDAALDSLIDFELLYAAAQEQQIRVSDQEVQAEIARSKARVGGDKAFAEALQRSGLTEAQLAVDTRKTMMVDRFVEQRLMKDVRVTPEAVRRFYDEHRQEFQRDGKVIPFDEARPAVEQALRESERRRRQQAYLVELRKTAKIERPASEPVSR
jgi:parvulin-like peptidyl-prolyl isomerase